MLNKKDAPKTRKKLYHFSGKCHVAYWPLLARLSLSADLKSASEWQWQVKKHHQNFRWLKFYVRIHYNFLLIIFSLLSTFVNGRGAFMVQKMPVVIIAWPNLIKCIHEKQLKTSFSTIFCLSEISFVIHRKCRRDKKNNFYNLEEKFFFFSSLKRIFMTQLKSLSHAS